ncbi:CRISPR-associated protein Cas10/Csm1 (subtype III-A) [Halanaerobium saccharolyticum]|jgi:CRISPR-associated protein Csm1|uniref:CRISPR system single-strand-specific deoxyribonuclease Cas10/Csm1 (subtype III-A) n=1 Tax=Halanaerobium saccharolyticum TaxID=43595 RepID=A0A2T5RH06_9FIRM|nr:CRISPR-associated protein Cas10/Csm1 (subtype III-A) [Halanaerobium saccharolyticum]
MEVRKINNHKEKILTLSSLLHDSAKLLVEDKDKAFDYQKRILDLLDSIDNETSKEVHQVLSDLFSSQEKDENSLAYFIEEAHQLIGLDLDSDYTYKPLKNIFSNIDIGKADINSEKYYLPSKINAANSFPVDKKEIRDEDLSKAASSFKTELMKILKSKDSDHWADNLYSLIEKYGWSYPERKGSKDTLVDHVHLVTSISIILYKNSNQEEENEKSFKLIGGDLSGIQSYIYDIAKINSGGVSKRLRARSFFVSILGEAILHQLLYKLELPQAAKIISAGGKFYLLAPNTKETEELLVNTSKMINNWFYDKFQSELYFNFASVDFKGKKFSDFGVVYEVINERLEKNKNHKFKEFLEDNQSFQLDSQYGANADLCESCNKLWTKEDSDLCHFCEQDLNIGKNLTSANYIAYKFNGSSTNYDIKLFDESPIYISLLEDKITEEKYDLLVNIKDDNISPAVPEILGTYSSYIPTFTDRGEKFELCKQCGDEECTERKNYFEDFPYLFSCLAASSVSEREEGLQALGVLKADVDMLGSIFSIGLGSKEINFSEIVSLSRMVDYYFSKVLPENFAKAKEVTYSNCSAKLDKNYIVYAGGDDLLILGPWDNLLLTSFYINDSFRDYTANNDNVTISAGLSLVKPKYPIAMSAQMATNEEERAKESGRNAFSVFGESQKWDKWLRVLPLANLLDESIQEDYFSMSFVRRLNRYAGQEKRYQENNDTKERKWIGMFQYDLGRNFYDNKKFNRDKKMQKALDDLVDLFLEEKDGMRGVENFKLPYHWSLYRNR